MLPFYRQPSGQAATFTQQQVLAAQQLHAYIMRTAAVSRNRDYVRERQRIMGIPADGGVAGQTAQRIFDITGLRIPGIPVTGTGPVQAPAQAPTQTPAPTSTPTQPQVTPRTKAIGEQAQITFAQQMTGNTPTLGQQQPAQQPPAQQPLPQQPVGSQNIVPIVVAMGALALVIGGVVLYASRREQEF